MYRTLLFLVGITTLVACASTAQKGPEVTDEAEIEVYLSPARDNTVCSVTVGIRNRSNVRKGPGYIDLEWRDAAGERVHFTTMRFDPVRVGYYDAKNADLGDLPCVAVSSVRVVGAEWSEFNEGRFLNAKMRNIPNLLDVDIPVAWDEARMSFYGSRS